VNARQFQARVIRPALAWLELDGEAAEALLLGTALAESGLAALVQAGGGPALGVYQIEPATHKDIWESYLAFRPSLAGRVRGLAAQRWPGPRMDEELVGNLYYASAIARVHYLRVPEPLPDAGDLAGLAGYWKRHYNTARGGGTEAHFIEAWRAHLGPPAGGG